MNFEDNVVVTIDSTGRCITFTVPSEPVLARNVSAAPFPSSSITSAPRIQLLDYLTSNLSSRVVPILDQIINPLRDRPLLCRPLIEAKRKEKVR